MWRVWAGLGAVVWLATIASSASMNFLAGYELGRSLTESRVFAVLGVCADTWKAAGPIFIAALWRERRRLPTLLAALVWLVCFVFAISAALGLAARNRSALVGGQETLRAQYENAVAELSEIERRRANLGEPRSVSEREAEILVIFAKPLPGGTVATLSDECNKDHWRTRADCANVAAVRREVATAVEAKKFDDRISSLHREVDGLRQRGALRDSDPQARLISAISLGAVAASNVGLLLMLLLVAMVEFISAFAPVVVHEYVLLSRAVATSRRTSSAVAAGRDSHGTLIVDVAGVKPLTTVAWDLFPFLADRVAPDPQGSEMVGRLISDYRAWCLAKNMLPLSEKEFVEKLDEIARGDLGGRILRQGSNYFGLRLLGDGRLVLGTERHS